MHIEEVIEMNARIMCEHYYFNYYKQYRPIGHKNFEKRYLKYFVKSSEMFCVRDGYKPKGFIDSILAEGFIYPQQIPVEKNWKTFERNSIEFAQEPKKKLSPDVEMAHRVVNIFTYLHNRTIKQMVSSPLLSQDFIIGYDNDSLDLCVYCFSSSFMEFSKKENMIIDFNLEQSKIKKYKKIFNKIKEKLGDDFMEV